MKILTTERLILRPWQESDIEPFARLNADPRVMEFFPETRNRQQSCEELNRIKAHFEEHGWGFWAVSVIDGADFIGFIGLKYFNLFPQIPQTVEIGWRLAFEYWGKGYATEGAQESLKYGFNDLNFEEIIAITAVQNTPSRNVMKKLGMHHNHEDDFDHPHIPEGNKVKRHVLYRLKKQEWNFKSE